MSVYQLQLINMTNGLENLPPKKTYLSNYNNCVLTLWWWWVCWSDQNKSLTEGTFSCRCHSFTLVCEQSKLVVNTGVEGITNKDGGLIRWDTRDQDYIPIADTSLLSAAALRVFLPPKRDAFYVTLDQLPCDVHEFVRQF